MEKVYLTTPEAKDIISQLLNDPPVILAGSAISMWDPTCLPVGKHFTEGMFDLLFPPYFLGNNSSLADCLNELWKKVPFEHLLEKCPNPQKLTPIIKKAFEIDEYNLVHDEIAKYFIAGGLRGLVTTNYDICLDKLLVDDKNIKKVVTEIDFQALDNITERVYFKIHGSADDEKGETLVWALNHESNLPEWKRELLFNMIKERSLLIIGYSGLDFEICPEILKMPVKNILWCTRGFNENNFSPNARRFLKEMPGYFLIGDMLILLKLLLGHSINPKRGEPSNDLLDSIKTEFTDCEIGIWRASILNSIGCASIALKASNELLLTRCSQNEDDLTSLKRQKAQALFHIGKYHQSGKEFYNTAKDLNLNSSLRVAILLDSCDAYRAHGNFLRAYMCLKEAKKDILKIHEPKSRSELQGRAALKEVLIWKHLYQIVKAIKIKFIANRIQKKSISLLKIASKASLREGNWFDFQQVRLWAERMDINPLILAYEIPYEAPPLKEGYDHLGYYVAQSMYLRDKIGKEKGHLSTEDEINWNKYIKICIEFENYPEIWKLYLIDLRRNITKKRIESSKIFIKAFFLCEYTILMRILELIFSRK